MNPATDQVTPLLKLDGVSRTYEMGDVRVPVLHDVDLEISAGELAVIVGPSGSGKSTLMNIVGGVDRPTTGNVWFEGRNLAACGDRELTEYRRETIGFVFQFYNLVPTLTARENVVVATELSPDSMDPREALQLVQLEDRHDHFPSQLSGGEQQRVAIARAIAKRPKLLLCDEPTGALDLTPGRRILEALDELNRRLGMTIVIITHNSAIAGIAHTIVRLGAGTIAERTANPARIEAREIEW